MVWKINSKALSPCTGSSGNELSPSSSVFRVDEVRTLPVLYYIFIRLVFLSYTGQLLPGVCVRGRWVQNTLICHVYPEQHSTLSGLKGSSCCQLNSERWSTSSSLPSSRSISSPKYVSAITRLQPFLSLCSHWQWGDKNWQRQLENSFRWSPKQVSQWWTSSLTKRFIQPRSFVNPLIQ